MKYHTPTVSEPHTSTILYICQNRTLCHNRTPSPRSDNKHYVNLAPKYLISLHPHTHHTPITPLTWANQPATPLPAPQFSRSHHIQVVARTLNPSHSHTHHRPGSGTRKPPSPPLALWYRVSFKTRPYFYQMSSSK